MIQLLGLRGVSIPFSVESGDKIDQKEVNIMNKYEVLYILNASIDDAAKEELIEKFKAIVTNAGGEVEGVDKWGVKKLAYEINFKSEGFYVLMNFAQFSPKPRQATILIKSASRSPLALV